MTLPANDDLRLHVILTRTGVLCAFLSPSMTVVRLPPPTEALRESLWRSTSPKTAVFQYRTCIRLDATTFEEV